MKIKSILKSSDIENTENLVIYRFTKDGRKFKVAFTTARANKKSVIKCGDNNVAFIQCVPIAGGICHYAEDIISNYQPSSILESDTVCILVISGKPRDIDGLDNGNIASATKYSEDTSKLYVMSERAFAKLEL